MSKKVNELHSVVYFVGDEPSKQNINDTVPFVGTKSYKTLLGWLADMDVDVTRVKFFNRSDRPFDKHALKFMKDVKVVALGKKQKSIYCLQILIHFSHYHIRHLYIE